MPERQENVLHCNEFLEQWLEKVVQWVCIWPVMRDISLLGPTVMGLIDQFVPTNPNTFQTSGLSNFTSNI